MKSHRKHAPDTSLTEVNKRLKGTPNEKTSPDGKKRRLDKLKAAELEFWFWFNLHEIEKGRAAQCRYRGQGHKIYAKGNRVIAHCWHDRDNDILKIVQRRYEKLWMTAQKDGLI